MRKILVLAVCIFGFFGSSNAQYEWRLNTAGRYVYVKKDEVGTKSEPGKTSSTQIYTTTPSRSKYENLVVFREKMAAVSVNGKYGFIDEYDKLVIPFTYDYADNFSQGLACVKLNGQYGYINSFGRIVIPIIYDDAAKFEYYVAKVKKDGVKFIIDLKGDKVEPKKEKYKYKGEYSEAIYVVSDGYRFGYVDIRDKEIIPLEYEAAKDFRKGRALVKQYGKWGCTDKTGKIVVPIIYDEVQPRDSMLKVKLNNKWGMYDSRNSLVIPITYDSISYFYNRVAAARVNGRWGFISDTGKIVVPLIYDEVATLNGETFEVVLNGKHGVVNIEGALIVPILYEKVIAADAAPNSVGTAYNGALVYILFNNQRIVFDSEAPQPEKQKKKKRD